MPQGLRKTSLAGTNAESRVLLLPANPRLWTPYGEVGLQFGRQEVRTPVRLP